MSLEARLWREACRPVDLTRALRSFAALLSETSPLSEVLLRRVDWEAGRVTTEAGVVLGDGERSRGEAESTVAGAFRQDLERWLRDGRIGLAAALPRDLAAVLVPGRTATAALVAPLGRGTDDSAAVVFVPSDGTVPPDEAVLGLAVEPLGAMLANERRRRTVDRRRSALEADRRALLERLQRQEISEVVIGEAGGLRSVMDGVRQVAATDAPVLIFGETGSGKEVIARAIHGRSARARGPVVRVNCGAIPVGLVDSELFGHERGAFTGAVQGRPGWFERADGGTLFLDEIGELPAAAQVRLLRVLQDGTLERVGGSRSIRVDVRIVAATHRDLPRMVREGHFREDLWYRLSVFPIRLPSLRERREDIPALAAHFAESAGRRLGGSGLCPTQSDVALLLDYGWPGNVRELAAVMERATILGNGKRLEVAAALGLPAGREERAQRATTGWGEEAPQRALVTLAEATRAHIERALQAAKGRIEGPEGAARLLDVNPHTLRSRMRRLGLDWSRFRS